MKYLLIAIILALSVTTLACDEPASKADEPAEEAAESQEEESALQTEEAQPTSLSLSITGMTCVSCAAGIEDHLREAEGVLSANIDFGARTAEIEYDPTLLDVDDLISIVEDAGPSFGASPVESDEKAAAPDES